MCGIAGYVGAHSLEEPLLERCLHLMHRRGPDAARYQCWQSHGRFVYFLHARLKIIDVDNRANQPFCHHQNYLIYNGELYNYVELKHELARTKRLSLKTSSDTEILMNVIETWGWEGLDRCEGMWAFAYFNSITGELTLSRDRFGEKPLYLYEDETGFYFGSEIKYIQTLLKEKLKTNIDHVHRFLIHGYKALYKSRDTFFKGILELPKATLLHLSKEGTQTQERYWKPPVIQNLNLTYAQAVEGVRERLIHSVKLRLRADVPLAFCMSGGMDSNSLIAIAKRICGYDVHGFTVVNEDGRYDEQRWVKEAVSALQIRHSALSVSYKDVLSHLRILIRQHDAPVYTISYYMHWLLMEQISKAGYRISISGTSADELLTGYYDHHLAYLYEVRRSPEVYEKALKAWKAYIQPIVRNPYLKNPNLFIENPNFRSHIYLNEAFFKSFLVESWDEPFWEEKFCDDLLRNRMLNELFFEATPVILHEDDLNAMFFSIENRSPFLDRQLFEFCSMIPTPFLIREGYAKVILRDAMKGIVPDAIVQNRRKVGFNAPLAAFLDLKSPKIQSQLLSDGPIFQYVKREKMKALFEKPFLENSESKFLFNFLNCKLFLEEFEP